MLPALSRDDAAVSRAIEEEEEEETRDSHTLAGRLATKIGRERPAPTTTPLLPLLCASPPVADEDK